jgi:WD40 repeat protein
LFTSSVLDNKDTSIKVWQVEDINNEENEKSAHSTTPPSPPPPSTYSRMALTLIHTLHGHTAAVLSLTLLDSHLLFSGSYDQTIRIWDLSTWSCIQTLKGHGGGVKALALSPPAHSCSSSNSRTLFSAGADNTIRAWGSIDARRRQGRGGDETRTIEKAAATTTTTPSYRHQERWICLRTLHGRHEDLTWPICLAVSDDGKFLASGSTGPFGGATIKIFYIGGDDDTDGHGGENGECLATFAPLRFDQKGAVNALLFSHSDNEVLVLYSGCSDGSLAAWKLTWKEDGLQRQGLKKGFF